MPQTVMFLCTGNYYRSRFAAIYFNHLAQRQQLNWLATSRGLRIGWPDNLGAMSHFIEDRLAAAGISVDQYRHMPLQCRACDLEEATLTVALKEDEHRPMMNRYFPSWTHRVRYWHVHDVDAAHPETALPEIEQLVERLIAELK
jgi:protein-tyrosine phosphatase